MRSPLRSPLAGGGGHGGGGHHGGGRGRGWGGPGWWGGPWYGDYGPLVLVQDSGCPTTIAPVLGTDGTVYQNACVAQARGVGILKSLPVSAMGKTPMKGMDGVTFTIDDQDVTPGVKIGFWVGVAAGAIGTSLLRSIFR